jgi:hypothetical protein
MIFNFRFLNIQISFLKNGKFGFCGGVVLWGYGKMVLWLFLLVIGSLNY